MLHDWGTEFGIADSLEFLRTVSMSHALRGGRVGAEIADLIKSENYSALVQFQVEYADDSNVYELIEVRQALAFWQKLPFLDLNIDKEAVAYATFLESQAKCKVMNAEFRHYRMTGKCNIPAHVMQVISLARAKIYSVLGECPKVSDLAFRFGPGSTSSIKKGRANPQQKFAETPTCSYELYSSGRLPDIVREMPAWFDNHVDKSYIDSDGWEVDVIPFRLEPARLEFVLKNALTFRSVIPHPTVDTLYQLGVGDWIARRLQARGLGTKDQGKNRKLAQISSLTNELATLDLSSASDTISVGLVRALLSEEWFSLLSASSVRTVLYKDQLQDIQMFSSMGNGFTFPLETLIFWALTSSCYQGETVSVYGDDIICPSQGVDLVIEVLEQCGFSINKKKSYIQGPFRESCGADYFKGINIRPFYQKSLVNGTTLFNLHNFYHRQFNDEMAAVVLEFIPVDVRLFGPDGYGNGHLLSDCWEGFETRQSRRAGWSGCFFETYQDIGLKTISIYPGDYVSPLYSVYIRNLEPSSSQGDNRDWLNANPRYIFKIAGTRPFVSDGTPVEFENPWKDFENVRRPYWPIPGKSGFKKVKIYTLSR